MKLLINGDNPIIIGKTNEINVIKFVKDLWQAGGFLRLLRFPPPIKLTTMIYPVTEIMLKMALNTISVTPNPCYTVFRDISLYYISYKYFRDKQLGFIMVDNSEVVEGSSPGSYTILNTNQILYIGK